MRLDRSKINNIKDRYAVAAGCQEPRPRGRNRERQATLWIRQHAFLRSAQMLEVAITNNFSELGSCYVTCRFRSRTCRGF